MLEPLEWRESKRKKPPKMHKRNEVIDTRIDLLKLCIKTVKKLC